MRFARASFAFRVLASLALSPALPRPLPVLFCTGVHVCYTELRVIRSDDP